MKKFLKEGLVYTVIKYFITFVAFIKSLLIAKTLGPSLLGSYAYIMLLVEYISYYNLGVYASMNREVAINMGDKSKREYSINIINASLTFSILFGGFIFLIFFCLGYLPENLFSEDFQNYRFHIFAYVLLNQFRWFFIRYFRLYEQYYILSFFEFASNAIMIIGVFFFGGKYLLNAAIYSALVANIICVFIALPNVKSVRFFWDFEKVKYLVKIGIPLILYGLSDKLFTSIDRFMIAQYLPREDLGFYQFGNTLAFGALMLIDTLTFIFYPKFLKTFYGKSKKDLKRKKTGLLKMIYNMEYFSAFLVVVAGLVIPSFIAYIMPSYTQSILISKVLLIGFCFKPITFLTSSFLVANNKQVFLIPITVVSMIVLTFSNYLLLNAGYGIVGVVIATGLTFCIHSIALMIAVFQDLAFLINIWRLILFAVLSTFIFIFKVSSSWLIVLWVLLYFTQTKKIIEMLKSIVN
tara:strand:- start:4238 stop:5632 length:1395 start_codon:yes stop_codon:yes gene_type:complete